MSNKKWPSIKGKGKYAYLIIEKKRLDKGELEGGGGQEAREINLGEMLVISSPDGV